jgi:predicted Zn-dependent peptidase
MRQPFQAASILRGPELYIREDHSSPLVEMGFFFPGGKARETGANAGITRLMLELMLQDGNATRQLEIYGGRLEPVVADDYFGFRIAVPSRHLAEGFERLRTVVKAPSGFEDRGRPDDTKFEDLRRRHAARAGAAGVPDAVNLLEAELFREHSYASSGEATAESLKNLSLEAVRGWYAENVRNLKPFVVIVGDVQGTAPAAFFVKEFSGSRMKDGKIADVQPKPLEKPATRDHDGSDRLSTVLIGFQVPPAGDANVYGMRALENYLGETGGMAEEIRDRKGVARRITCGYRPRLRGGSIIVTARVDMEGESRAVAALREEISRLLAQPLPYADFQAALAGAAGVRALRDQVKWAQIESLTGQLLADGGDRSAGGLEAYQDFARSIEDMGEEDFQGLARRILDMDKAVTVVVHGRADAKR